MLHQAREHTCIGVNESLIWRENYGSFLDVSDE